MKSICIKTNNINILKYLLKELNNCECDNIYFSYTEFKRYNNIIIHYTGTNTTNFISTLTSILSTLVIDELEENILLTLIRQHYFYFDKSEISKILEIYYELVSEDYYNIFNQKYYILNDIFSKYLSNNKSIVLDGFINFRVSKYKELLTDILHESISNYIIKKEYLEFISLLKTYISSQPNSTNTIHLIYSNSDSILLDENNQIISNSALDLPNKFFSDISFSQNDYTLNSLLSLLPKKLYVHLITDFKDEFITTLQLIFENNIEICTNCSTCKLYKQTNLKKQN